jgi:hypothetical protein
MLDFEPFIRVEGRGLDAFCGLRGSDHHIAANVLRLTVSAAVEGL